jgi:hypothetical protein
VVKNNIFYQSDGDVYNKDSTTGSDVVMSHNLWYGGTGPGTNSLTVNPMFVNPSNPFGPDGIIWTSDDGFRLQEGSPACGAGELGGDIGAYPCSGLPSTSQCSDGLDNDGDGATDMADPGCSSASDDNESDCTGGQANPGDVDCDGDVDIIDLVIIAQNFNKSSGFYEGADQNNDGRVDIVDLVIVAQNFG